MKEDDLRVKKGETHALAVRAVCPSECSLSVGAAQASDALTVPVLGVQGLPARASLVLESFFLKENRQLE